MTQTEALNLIHEQLQKLWLLGDKAAELANPALDAVKEALAQPEHEPVACTSLCVECTKRGDWVCAKAIPPQRTWVGLDDEEMNAALDYWSEDERSAYGGAHAANGEYVSMIDTWRYIEAKLKEKNT